MSKYTTKVKKSMKCLALILMLILGQFRADFRETDDENLYQPDEDDTMDASKVVI